MKGIFGFFLTFCLLSMTYNCKTPQSAIPVYTSQDSLITIPSGMIFKVELPSNIGTGYSWSLLSPVDTTILQFIDQEYMENDLMTSEEESREIWRFRSQAKGQAQIELIYKRPWEQTSEESKEKVFQVIVQ
jgi:inhibitor of cysteine peptidase